MMIAEKQRKTDTMFDKGVAWAAQYVPVRQRHVFTRRNRLRLRYGALAMLTGAALMASALIETISRFNSHDRSFAVAYFAAAASDPFAPEQKMAAVQKRLQRYTPDEKDGALQLASFAPPQPREEVLEIGKGDTLAGVLQEAGVGAAEAYEAVQAMKEFYDPRKLRAGQEIHVRFEPSQDAAGGYIFSSLRIGIDTLKSVILNRTGEDGFKATLREKETVQKTYADGALIELSLYGSAEKAGIPAPVIAQAIRIYSWDVDFQRDIRKGDAIEIMYDQTETKDGHRVKTGDVLYARLTVDGHDIPVYRYETEEGDVDYYTPEGTSLRKALMQTPIDGARLSSGFGMRHHPVLGYDKMHKGIDFAAPTGTPIYAAGDGTVEKAGRWNAYGNYVRIRHNSTMKTAYAHMSRFAPGIAAGKRVKQGDIIGYVGATGRVTGAHLHYEVLVNDSQVNPKTIKMAQGETLTGKKLAAFKKHVEDLNREYASLRGDAKLAMRETNKRIALR